MTATSGNVLEVIDAIPEEKGILLLILLGAHVRRTCSRRNVEVWLGECHVHKGIRGDSPSRCMRIPTPRSAHPERPPAS